LEIDKSIVDFDNKKTGKNNLILCKIEAEFERTNKELNPVRIEGEFEVKDKKPETIRDIIKKSNPFFLEKDLRFVSFEFFDSS